MAQGNRDVGGITVDLTLQRRFFAEEIAVTCNLRTPALVEALATVPRERYLGPGPWLIRSEVDVVGGPRQTTDDDPRHLYHNVAVAIDPARQLFNGAPSILSTCIDALGLRAGHRVLHVGCGLGYYSALMAHCVGESGRVVAVDIDPALAADARSKLMPLPWVETREGDGTAISGETFDAILVNAGMTHPHEAWLDALSSGGRLILPLTCTMGPMGNIGKGFVLRITNTSAESLDVRIVSMVAIYSAVGIRDAALDDALGQAMRRGPFPPVKRLRRDRHEAETSCWLHADTFCLTTAS